MENARKISRTSKIHVADLDDSENTPNSRASLFLITSDLNNLSEKAKNSIQSEVITSKSETDRLQRTKSLEETITLADLTIAQSYREKNTIRKWGEISSKQYPIISTTTEELGENGAGLELYFIFVKHLGFLFAFLTFLSIWPIYQNYNGNGLESGAAKQWWDYWTIANQKIIESKILQDAEKELEGMEKSRDVLAIADFIGAVCFIIMFWRYHSISRKTVAENFKNNVTAADYAIEIKGFPETVCDAEPVREHFSQFGEVVEVYLARKYGGMLNEFKDRVKISTELGYQRILEARGSGNRQKLKNFEKKIKDFDIKMHERFEQGGINHEMLPVNRAYLIFNKLEDKKLCLDQTRSSRRCCQSKSERIAGLFQSEVTLKVKQTTEPSNILWENLETSKFQKILRKSVSVLLAIFILLASSSIIYMLKTYETALLSDDYCINTQKIDSSISLDLAKLRYTRDPQIFCYCKFKTWTEIINNTSLASYCTYFIKVTTTNLMIKFFSSCGVILINFILRFVFKRLSKFERVSNKTKEQLNIMVKVFVATFINTALIVLLVNANFSRVPAIYYIPYTDKIFTGTYADFTREWYLNIGDSIVLTMIMCVFSPHILTLLILYPIAICKRKCCYRRYKTQSDLNRVFAGPEFDLATRNSHVLNLIFTCYLYSSSIPFLNAIAAVALFSLYWTDKFLILRHYKKPPLLSYHLNSAAIKMLPFIIIMHCAFAVHMYGADSIFPSSLKIVDNLITAEENGIYDRLFSVHGALNSFIIIFTLAASAILFCLPQVALICKRKTAKVEEETQSKQGTYKEELETIISNGLHTYTILENPDYRELILALNSAADKIQTIRYSLTQRNSLLSGN